MFQFVSLFDGIENITNIIEKSEQKYLQNMQNTASLKKSYNFDNDDEVGEPLYFEDSL